MDNNKNNYKDTLLMPNTDFPMRGNLGQREPEIQAKWDDLDLYRKVMKKNEGRPLYVLHDGPPYANGSIHAGTAMNKILKDFVIRYRNMAGYRAPYLPGWDTHGLPIENALSKDRKVDRKSVEVVAFRKLCAEYAKEQVDIQRRQFKRLGVLGEWENPYVTMDKRFEAAQIRLFGQMVEKGLIYKGLKPVYWSPSSESALAEAEIEYHDVKSPSIYVSMPVVDGKGILPDDALMLVWTTTPWTIPANLAICAGPDIEYALFTTDNKKKYVAAKNLVEQLKGILGWEKTEILHEYIGSELEGITYKHPLYDRVSPVILGDHVTIEDGTGLVHTAPGHGEDDFLVGQKYNLEAYCPVDSLGRMTKEAGKRFEGLFVDDCNPEVIKALDEAGSLLKSVEIIHSYPHDWRTKKPVIFRATPQWFASIDILKQDILDAIKKIKWYPSWGDVRLSNMIKDRGSWCISRQRAWGVPIPAFYTEKGNPILNKTIIEHVATIFEKEGSDAWFTMSAKELLPEGYVNEESPNGIFRKETDIMDVWFDSGSSHHGAMIERGFPYPADLYFEGSDQYRGWFNSSLITGIATEGKSPYKTLVSHGFVLDGEGRKMSKSLGNTVDPNKICNTMGADIYRLWVSSVDYQADVRLSDDLLKQVSESYRKIRNTLKFLLGNLFDYDETKNKVPYGQLEEIDKYIILKTDGLMKEVLASYDDFRFDDVYRLVNNYVVFLSAFYLDFSKDVLYIEKADDPRRRQIQTVIYHATDSLLRIMTPIIPHTASEAYDLIPHREKEDVYLTDISMPEEYPDAVEIIDKYDRFMEMREIVLKALELARNNKVIGKSMAARVVLYPNEEYQNLIDNLQCNLQLVFIVSKLEIKSEGKGSYDENGLSVDVFPCEGVVCDRCWMTVPDTDENGLCPRCHDVLLK